MKNCNCKDKEVTPCNDKCVIRQMIDECSGNKINYITLASAVLMGCNDTETVEDVLNEIQRKLNQIDSHIDEYTWDAIIAFLKNNLTRLEPELTNLINSRVENYFLHNDFAGLKQLFRQLFAEWETTFTNLIKRIGQGISREELDSILNTRLAPYYTKAEIDTLLSNLGGVKGVAINGASHEPNDNGLINLGTDFLKGSQSKFDSIEHGAEVNVQSDWNINDMASDAFIKNKPNIPTKYSDLIKDVGNITPIRIVLSEPRELQDDVLYIECDIPSIFALTKELDYIRADVFDIQAFSGVVYKDSQKENTGTWAEDFKAGNYLYVEIPTEYIYDTSIYEISDEDPTKAHKLIEIKQFMVDKYNYIKRRFPNDFGTNGQLDIATVNKAINEALGKTVHIKSAYIKINGVKQIYNIKENELFIDNNFNLFLRTLPNNYCTIFGTLNINLDPQLVSIHTDMIKFLLYVGTEIIYYVPSFNPLASRYLSLQVNYVDNNVIYASAIANNIIYQLEGTFAEDNKAPEYLLNTIDIGTNQKCHTTPSGTQECEPIGTSSPIIEPNPSQNP